MAKKIHFPKGEGIKIIRQASEAKEKDSIYILAVDETYAEMIVVSVSGAKRKIGFRLPENVGLTDIINDDGDVTTEGSVYLKEQIDKFLADLKQGNTTITNTLETLKDDLENHIDDTNNPHGVTASQIGLGNVDNTSDADKPISNAQKTINDELLESVTEEGVARQEKDTELEEKINNYKSDVEDEIERLDNGKLSKTTTTISAPTAEYKFVYLTNEANETRRMLAGDLGKNIANSTLVSIAGAGFTQGANWTHNTAGFHYYLKGLPDKSNDNDFDRMRVQNSDGQEAYSNGKTFLKKMPTAMSESERLTYLREMAGDNNLNFLAINDILDRIVLSSNNIQQVVINGSNFNFSPSESSIYIINTATNAETLVNFTILSKVFLVIDITSNVPLGDYRVKIVTNTNQAVISSVYFSIIDAQNVEVIDLSNLTWESSKNPNITTDTKIYDSSASGVSVISNEFANGNIGVPDNGFNEAFRSSVIPNLNLNDSFKIEGVFNIDSQNHGANVTSYFGLSYDDGSELSYMSLPVIYTSIYEFSNYNKRINTNNGAVINLTNYPVSASIPFKILKKNNLLVIVISATASNGQQFTSVGSSTITSFSTALRFIATMGKHALDKNNNNYIHSNKTVQILSAIKMN